MNSWQTNIVLLYGITSFILLIISLFKCRTHEGRVGKPWVIGDIFGSFLWMDHIILGVFWSVVSSIVLLLQDWLLFLLILSFFWLVRSLGETLYWFLQQFMPRKGNEPSKFWINKLAPGEGVWFLNQLYWQCVTVITLLLSIYLSYLWLTSLN